MRTVWIHFDITGVTPRMGSAGRMKSCTGVPTVMPLVTPRMGSVG